MSAGSDMYVLLVVAACGAFVGAVLATARGSWRSERARRRGTGYQGRPIAFEAAEPIEHGPFERELRVPEPRLLPRGVVELVPLERELRFPNAARIPTVLVRATGGERG